MRERFKRVVVRIDELTLRERAVILAAVLVALFSGWHTYLIEPLQKEQKSLQAQLETRRGQLKSLSDQFVKTLAAQEKDPNAANRKKLAALRAEREGIQRELEEATASLVAPEALLGILQEMLRSQDGLNIVSLSGTGATPLVKPPAGDAAKGDGERIQGLYRHGVEIRFAADFPTTLRYLRQVESLPWRFFWDSISYSVSEHPRADVTIRLSTLSLKGHWIGT
jgi:MSHA biogenesis protein MshJ